jgi:hypothetical protein
MANQSRMADIVSGLPDKYRQVLADERMAGAMEDEAAFKRNLALTKEAGSTAASFAEYEAPLSENPAMSVEEYASQMASAVRETAAAKGQTVDPAAVKEVYDNAYRTGTRVRVQQYITDMVNGEGPDFDDTHPGFMELQSHFARRSAENPDDYDAIRDFLVSAIAPAVRAAAPGVPPEKQAEYINSIIEGDGVGRGLLGPKVESGWSIY